MSKTGHHPMSDEALRDRIVSTVDSLRLPPTPPLRRRGVPVGRLAATAAVAFAVIAGLVLWPRAMYDEVAAPAVAATRIVVVSDNQLRSTGRIDFVDLATGVSLASLPTDYHPDFAADAQASAIYLMSTATANFQLGVTTLRSLDARTLSERWHVRVEDRLLYPLLGPSTLAVSPDGSRLVVAHYKELGPDRADYWVTEHDTRSGVAVGRTDLPNCGGMYLNFTSDGTALVVTCAHSSDVRFVSSTRWSVETTVALPTQSAPGYEAVAGTAVRPGRLIVVLRDLRIATIDTSTHALSIDQRWRVGSAVALPNNVGVSSDGRRLWVPLETGGIAMFDLGTGSRSDLIEPDVQAIAVVNDKLLVAGVNSFRASSATPLTLPASEGWTIWRLVPVP